MRAIEKFSRKYHVKKIISLFLAVWMVLLPVPLRAVTTPAANTLPGGIQSSTITVNPANFDYSVANQLTINNAADGSIVNWTNFDIGSAAAVQINQASSSAAMLNRVLDGNATGIMGALSANGRVFIVNPAGVVFGSGSSVNVSQLIASSLNITDVDFLAKNYTFEGGIDGVTPNEVLGIINNGTITGSEGIVLIGEKILNAGSIVTGEDGFVVMAAGDKVVLGDPSTNILVEMSSSTSAITDAGNVTNDTSGSISSPSGQIVLAAGDIFSAALPTGDRAVKVHLGNGTVDQKGSIDASGTTGNGGVVSLTSGDRTTLHSGSVTKANAGTDADSGQVTVHSKDRAEILNSATVEAKGGYFPEKVEDSIAPLWIITDTSVELSGDTINLAGSIDASAAYNTSTDVALQKKGKIIIDADNIHIADGPKPTTPPDNTIYEEWIEMQSQGDGSTTEGTDLEIIAHSKSMTPEINITVGEIDDGEILGGSGDITMGSRFSSGGISFVDSGMTYEAAAIKTNDGGNIFMVAGSGGIYTDGMTTTTASNDKFTDPGRIRLLTSNDGEMRIGTLDVNGGSIVEISAIASGDLLVEGGVASLTNTVNKDSKDIGFARVCLVSIRGNVIVDGTDAPGGQLNSIQVRAHGKETAVSEILICAGKNVDISNLRSNETIRAESKVSEKADGNLADASISIGAGGLDEDQLDPIPPGSKGVISINGETDINAVEVVTEATASGSGTPLSAEPSEDQNGGDPDVVNVFKEEVNGFTKKVNLDIDRDFAEQGLDATEPCPDCPCVDCPVPPVFPIEIFAVDDEAEEHMNTVVDKLTNGEMTVLWNDVGDDLKVVGFTQPEDPSTGRQLGVLTLNAAGEFEYTPAEGFADTVTFEYVIIDLTSGQIDDAVVTIDMTNTLPDGDSWLGTVHMDTSVADVTLVVNGFTDPEGDVPSGESDLLVKADTYSGDPYPGTGIHGGDLVYDGTDYDYTPDTTNLSGYIGDDVDDFTDGGYNVNTNPDEKFAVQIWDGEYKYNSDGTRTPVYGDGTVSVDLTNTLPNGDSWLGTTHMDTSIIDGALATDGFFDPEDTIQDVVVVGNSSNDFNKSFGGTLAYDGTYDYDPDTTTLPGYVGDQGVIVDDFDNGGYVISDNADDRFNVNLWDGQRDYVFNAEGDQIVSNDKVFGSGTVSVDLTNDLPIGNVWIGTTHMDTSFDDRAIQQGNFFDNNGDTIVIGNATVSSDDYNKSFGGTLTHDNSGFDYDPDLQNLPGYIGDDNDDFSVLTYVADDKFDVQLWDGQRDYVFSGDGQSIVSDDLVYGSGTVSVDLTNDLPIGNVWIGTTHMDTSFDDRAIQQGNFFDNNGDTIVIGNATVSSDDYNKSFGGALTHDNSGFDYDPDLQNLPGYIGDDNDDYSVLTYVADDKFDVQLSDGQRDYVFSGDGQSIVSDDLVYGSGTVSLDLTNTLPEGDSWLGTTHMNTSIVDGALATDGFFDPEDIIQDVVVVGNSSDDFNKSFGGTLAYDGTYDYDPDIATLPGYVGDTGVVEDDFDNAGYVISDNADDRFNVNLWDGQRDYVFNSEGDQIVSDDKVFGDGTVSVDLTNILPIAEDDSFTALAGQTIIGNLPFDDQPDNLSPGGLTDPTSTFPAPPQQFITSNGGTVTINPDGSFSYEPPSDTFLGPDTFEYEVWDGQYEYTFNGESFQREEVLVSGEITVSFTEPPPVVLALAAPLPELEAPTIEGCPMAMAAVAIELGINSDRLQVAIGRTVRGSSTKGIIVNGSGRSLTDTANIQPCSACEKVIEYAAILRDTQGERMNALAQIFNQVAPADAPFTPEMETAIAVAFAENFDNPDMPQYAAAMAYIDAFVQYVAVLETELGSPIEDPVAYVLEKYGGPMSDAENENIAAYVQAQLLELGV